ncbi:MAG: trigger factor [Desulfobacterales bacterium]|nr:trigger factor [Desulfobacterales bacterium]
MQVSVEDLSTVKKKLHIEIPEAEVARELDKAYNKLKKTAKIKGFRPGKAPRAVLERLFKKDVHADVSSELIQNSLFDAIKQTNFNIIGHPQIDPNELDVKGSFKYDAIIEIHPEIAEIDFKGLALKKTVYTVTDEEVDTQLKIFQKNLAKQTKITEDRPAREGDIVLIDYEGFVNGEPFPETRKTENFTLKIGEGNILKNFDTQLIGMNPGTTAEIKVDFPDDYFNDKLAKRKIDFQVTLKEIKEEELPDINDQFAKDLGDFETLEELKSKIKENLIDGYKKRQEQELHEQIFAALTPKVDFEVPELMINYELESIIADFERSFVSNTTTMESLGFTRKNLSEKYRPTAEKKVRQHLILNKIIEQENLSVSDEDLENGFKEMAAALNQPIEKVKEFYDKNPDRIDFFKQNLLEKHAIKLIIETGNVEETKPLPKEEAESKEKSNN